MGALNFRWLVNVGLLALPIAITLGVLFGIQSHREATGQPPIFTPEPSGKPKVDNNGITVENNCMKAYGIEPPAKGQKYILNPNQWGVVDGEGGTLCLNVTSNNNGTYATNTTAPEFYVSWQFPQRTTSQPVHAFPNIKVDGGVFPASLDSLKQINVDLEWTYGVGNGSVTTTDQSALEGISLNSNVAIDMFLDEDKTTAEDSAKAAFEVMVWFATFGTSAQPLGMSKGIVATKVLDGTTFNLYVDQNEQEQWVLTWLASTVTEKFHGDISPLLEDLLTMGKANFPTKSDYLGYLSLGTETFYVNEPVTFSVPQLSIDVRSS